MSEFIQPYDSQPEKPKKPETPSEIFSNKIDDLFTENLADVQNMDDTLEQYLYLVHETDQNSHALLLKRQLNPDDGNFMNRSIEMNVYNAEGYSISTHEYEEVSGGLQRSDEYSYLELDENPVGYSVKQTLEFATKADPDPVYFPYLKDRHMADSSQSNDLTTGEARNAAQFFDHYIDDIFNERRDEIISYTPKDKNSTGEMIETKKTVASNFWGEINFAISLARETTKSGTERKASVKYLQDDVTTYMTFSSDGNKLISTHMEKNDLNYCDNPTSTIMNAQAAKQLRNFIRNPKI